MSRLALIVEEVKQLKSNTKKKYSLLCESISQLQKELEEKNQRIGQGKLVVFPLECFEKVLNVIGDIKKAKVNITFLGFVQNLLNLQLLTQSTHSKILDYLVKIVEINKDTLQIKLQQTFFLLISPTTLSILNITFLEKIFRMLILLRNSKIPLITNSSTSSLHQVISNLIKEAIERPVSQGEIEQQQNNIPSNLQSSQQSQQNENKNILQNGSSIKIPSLNNGNNSTAEQSEEKIRNLAQILYDFVVLADDQRCQWWPKNLIPDKDLGFNILFSALLQLGNQIRKYKEIQSVFRFNFFPIIKKQLASSNISNMQNLNLIRALTRTVVFLNEEFDALETLVEQTKIKEYTQAKYWALEGLIYIVSEPDTLHSIFSSLNLKREPNNVFMQMFSCAVKFTSNICGPLSESLASTKTANVYLPSKTSRALETNDQDIEQPTITIALCFKQAIDFFMKLSSSLELVCRLRVGVELGEKMNTQQKTPQFEQFKNIYDILWKDVYSSIKLLLSQPVEEQLFQNLLITIQTFTNISGTIGNRSSSDQFIKAICNYSLPKDSDMTPRNIQTNKMVLNIAHCLGNLLEINSWIYILVFLQKSEKLYQKNRIARDNTQEEFSKLSDIQALQNTLDYLFSNSQTYENNHLLTLLNSLFELIVDQISVEKIQASTSSGNSSNNSSGSKKDSQNNSNSQKQKQGVFSLQKLYETLKVNLYRIDLIWETVSANFLSIATTRNQFFREKAVETLGDFILDSFQYLEDEYQENKYLQKKQNFKPPTFKDKDKWSRQSWQHTLFQPWIDIQCHSESKDIIMNNILKILQNNGHVISKNGWSQILDILKGISADSSQAYIFTGIKCIELLVNQYLGNLHHSKISTLLMIVENFKKYSNDNNINYLTCDMLWHIGDHLAKSQTESQSKLLVNQSEDQKIQSEGILLTEDKNQGEAQEQVPKEEFGTLIASILEKLLSLCVDPHAEARNSAQHIFSSLIVHNFHKLPQELCLKILDTMVWEMGERVINNLKSEIRLGSDKVKVWEETALNTSQHITKIVKRYLSLIEKNDTASEEENSKQMVQLIDKNLQLLFKLLEINLNDLNKETVKSLRDLFGLKPFSVLQAKLSFSKIILHLQTLFQTVPPQIKSVKSIFQQLHPECISLIDEFIALTYTNNEEQKSLEYHIPNIFELLYLVVMYPRLVNEEYELQTNKIFPDEKLPMETINKCVAVLPNMPLIEEEFVNLIRKVINLPLNSQIVDGLQRKIIPIMMNQLKQETQFNKQYIDQYIISLQTAILTKNNLKYMEFILKTNQASQKNKPIWIIATESFVELTMFLTQADERFIQKIYNILCEYFIVNKYDIDRLIKYYTPEMLKEYFECEKSLLDLIINKFLPLPSISNKNLRQFGYVLYNNSQLKINTDQKSQLNLDDLGINFAKNSLNLLFKASSSESSSSSSNFNKAVLFLPFLLNRCRLTLEDFLQEQKFILGTKIKDVDYILSLLKTHTIHPNSFANLEALIPEQGEITLPYEIMKNTESAALNSEVGHLFYLLPLIKKCLTINSNYFENSLNLIFTKVFDVLGVQQYYS